MVTQFIHKMKVIFGTLVMASQIKYDLLLFECQGPESYIFDINPQLFFSQ